MTRRVEARPVMDGNRVKWTLEQVQSNDPGLVRLDWLRFTLPLSAVVSADEGLPQDWDAVALLDRRSKDLIRETRAAEVDYTTGPAVARSAALQLLKLLPEGYSLGEVEARGMDYYTSRATILRDGAEVAHVLTGGKQIAQAGTVHFNLHGKAMLHMERGDYARLHAWVLAGGGWITRVDLALDIWTGADVNEVRHAYLAGEFDVRGKRPGQREIGSWTLGHSRTFEVGSRDTGKLARCYEKGDEVFGHEAADPWVRYEVEIRNNNRIIDLAVLLRPADFFAGAYPFMERALAHAKAQYSASVIKTKPRLIESTVLGEVTRLARWVKRTAAPAVCALLKYSGEAADSLILGEAWRTPGRLVGHAEADIRRAFDQVAAAFAPPSAPLLTGA